MPRACCPSVLPGLLRAHRLRWIAPLGRKPGVTNRVETGVVRVEIDEAALDQKVAYLEHIAPAARVRDACAPGAVPWTPALVPSQAKVSVPVMIQLKDA